MKVFYASIINKLIALMLLGCPGADNMGFAFKEFPKGNQVCCAESCNSVQELSRKLGLCTLINHSDYACTCYAVMQKLPVRIK